VEHATCIDKTSLFRYNARATIESFDSGTKTCFDSDKGGLFSTYTAEITTINPDQTNLSPDLLNVLVNTQSYNDVLQRKT
jgi:hypothetical protein